MSHHRRIFQGMVNVKICKDTNMAMGHNLRHNLRLHFGEDPFATYFDVH